MIYRMKKLVYAPGSISLWHLRIKGEEGKKERQRQTEGEGGGGERKERGRKMGKTTTKSLSGR